MADFVAGMTSVANVDDSIILEFDKQFLLELAEQGVMSQFATYKKEIGAKSIKLPKYARLPLATTPLTDKEEPVAQALVDSEVTLEPKEHGLVVVTTELAKFQTGGVSDTAAAKLVGENSGRTTNRLAMLALDAAAAAQIVRVNARAADTDIIAGDIMDPDTLNIIFNRLSRNNVLGAPGASGDYVMVAHDDVIHDLRAGTAVGSWQDTHKYAIPGALLKNEIGMFKGFRVIRDNLSTIGVDAGTGAVDVYTSYFLGFNAFGQADSQMPRLVIKPANDNLDRFMNFGWKATLEYKIIEPLAGILGRSSSSVGDNA